MAILHTERLTIRPFTDDDLDAAYAIFEGHPDVWRYDPGRQRTYEERRDEILYRIAEYHRHDMGCMAVTLREVGTLIGYCGLQLYVLDRGAVATPEVELFYKLGRDYWDRGYALEAALEMRRHAFEDLKLARIVTIASEQNERSLALMRKLGMRLEPVAAWPGDMMGTVERDAAPLRPEQET